MTKGSTVAGAVEIIVDEALLVGIEAKADEYTSAIRHDRECWEANLHGERHWIGENCVEADACRASGFALSAAKAAYAAAASPAVLLALVEAVRVAREALVLACDAEASPDCAGALCPPGYDKGEGECEGCPHWQTNAAELQQEHMAEARARLGCPEPDAEGGVR